MIKKIYICIPGDVVTGGPETLHQFANIISRFCKNVYIYYFGSKRYYETPEKYKKYCSKICTAIEDSPNNIMFVPETNIKLLSKYNYINKCVWWLSVDNYYAFTKRYKWISKCSNRNTPIKYMMTIMYWGIYILKKLTGRVYDINDLDDNVFHLYNCEYAKQFLLANGIVEEKTMYMCGPLEKLYFDPIEKESILSKKENIIAFNPAKGYKYIILLQKVNINNYQFVPIKNMTSQQVKELLLRAKLYVDFGFFPGPERIPRQAAMCYCSILTSKSGSAANDIDVPIPKENKVDVKHFNPKNTYKKVVSLIENFEQDVAQYDIYREKIRRQDLEFEENIKILVKKINVDE